MPLFTHKTQRVMFIHIPKTAGTAIEKSFADAGWGTEFLHMPNRGDGPDRAPCNPQHWHQGPLRKWAYSQGPVTFEFAIVRNPFTRLISEMIWREAGHTSHINKHGYDNKFFQKLDSFTVRNLQHYIKNETEFQNDKEFFYEQGKKFHADNHFRPQFHYVRPVTNIYKYEDLKPTVWNTLKEKFKLNVLTQEYTRVDLKKSRPVQIPSPSSQFRELYTQVYGPDHEKFNYPLPF